MNELDDRLKSTLSEIDRADGTPEFRILWARARAEADAKRRRPLAYWLAPTGVAAAGLVVFLIVIGTPTPEADGPDARDPSAGRVATLEDLSAPDAWAGPMDDFGSGFVAARATAQEQVEQEGQRATDADESADEVLVAASDELPTDFLMEMDVVTWDQVADERSL
jgi:hypothetical protein